MSKQDYDLELASMYRLQKWRRQLVKDQAVPVLLLGVAADHGAGRLVAVSYQDITEDRLRLFLEQLLINRFGYMRLDPPQPVPKIPTTTGGGKEPLWPILPL